VRSHLVPAAIMKMANAIEQKHETIEIWGDGTARREFLFADDLADFIWTFLPKLAELPDPMNVGVGEDHSVTDYYETTARLAGWRGRFTYDASKPAGMKRKLLDVSAQRALGWSPATSLNVGIRETIGYYASVRETHSPSL
jgi:nucleoside-diphosphate-sugar epimerase